MTHELIALQDSWDAEAAADALARDERDTAHARTMRKLMLSEAATALVMGAILCIAILGMIR